MCAVWSEGGILLFVLVLCMWKFFLAGSVFVGNSGFRFDLELDSRTFQLQRIC